MSREEIKETVRKCDAYIEDLEKFKQALKAVEDLSTLTPEALNEWKEQMLESCPESYRLIAAMLNLLPGGNET